MSPSNPNNGSPWLKPLARPVRPEEALSNPSQWSKVTRTEAMRDFHDYPTVVVTRVFGLLSSRWLDREHPCMRGNAPYDLGAFQYYRFKEQTMKSWGAGRGGSAPKRVQQADQYAADLVPVEESP
ncbi:MAG: hypothetical protein M3Y08_15650, partial [Fibrobacterota bacterium]|nr:hypothetical protein [Fibrobacterota bacterium]